MTTARQTPRPETAESRLSDATRFGAFALSVLLATMIAVTVTGQGASAQGPQLFVDADPAGNGPTHIGPRNVCVSVANGDSFDIDIVIDDVEDLLAWELYLEYDPKIVEIVDRDVRLFQEANRGSSVYDVSEALPNSDGLYRLAAADTADPLSPDTGSGVLARLSLKAIAPGTSTASLAVRDLNDDGTPDIGPFLRNTEAVPIGDDDGDTLFDNVSGDAKIAVDSPCPTGTGGQPPTADTASSNGGWQAVYILGLGVGAAALAGVSVLFVLYRRRARAQSL